VFAPVAEVPVDSEEDPHEHEERRILVIIDVITSFFIKQRNKRVKK
jgi:hypothetical protein